MEDEEEVVAPPSSEHSLPESVQQCDTVSTAVDLPEIPLPAAEKGVEGEESVRDEREGVVGNEEGVELERDGDGDGDVKLADEATASPVVEVELAAVEDEEKVEREIGGEDVVVAKPESEVGVSVAEPMAVGEDVEELKPESEVEVAEGGKELVGEGEGVEAGGSENEAGNVDEIEEIRDEEVTEGNVEMVNVMEGVGGVVELEGAEREIEDNNVEKGKVLEEEPMKVEDLEVRNEEIVEDEKEATISTKEVEGDGVVIGEEVTIVKEEVVAKDEEMGEEGREELGSGVEGKVDEGMKVEEVFKKDEEMAVEETLCANEVEGDGAVDAEAALPVNEEVLLGNEAEKDEQGRELEAEEKVEVGVLEEESKGKEEEGIEVMDRSPAVTKNDEAVAVAEEESKGERKEGAEVTVTKTDEAVVEEESKGEREEGAEEMDLSPSVKKSDEVVVEEEGTPMADTEIETEAETMKSGSGSGGKRKRVPKPKPATPVKTPSRKVVGEDVCFICLDGGDLVLCDRRGCPKAYHPSCVDHDEEFFKTKGRWNCGWHLCNKCGKNAYFMCYTCQFSLCKNCSKDADIFCVRGNKGFCESCMKTIMVIENSAQNEMGHDAFSDKSSWEYLFKDYWLEQKEKLGFTSDDLSKAKNPWKDSDKHQTSIEVQEGNTDAGGDSDCSLGNLELSDSKRKKAKRKPKSVDYNSDSSMEKDASSGKRKTRRRLKSQAKDSDSDRSSPDTSSRRGKKARRLAKSRSKGVGYGDDSGDFEWASKELLEFVMHMKNGDQSVLTQFDVQGLLLEYIKRNKLRDPRRQSQIICDSMLQKLFGKPRVGHFEMLKLLESHFFLKDNSHGEDNQGVADTEVRQQDADDNTDSQLDGGKSRGRKSRKRGDERGSQSNLDDYAAIDNHNINLIFLRRSLMEALMENSDTFQDKVTGSFVRIRISGSSQKQDIYRLVQITGISKAAESYKVGKRTTDAMLEILNLDKTETISIDTISNQEFSEDECKRLRQSIKCGLINRMTVRGILEKAKELHEVRVVDWLEAEIVRLSHLRDRASEKGRKKELRECVEKLQLLKTPEERQRRLDEIPVVHADPKMDPSCESEDEIDTTRQVSDRRPRESGFSRRGRDSFSSRKGGPASIDSWSANAKPPNLKWEPNRNSSGKDFSGGREDAVFASPTREHTWSNGLDKGTPRSWEKPRMASDSSLGAGRSVVRPDLSAAIAVSESPRVSSGAAQTDSKLSETEKMWHYRDPSGKVQGPFSMSQLRKWSNTGYFPTDLRIWRISLTENDSMLLTDFLAGRFDKEVPSVGSNLLSSIDTSKITGGARSSATGVRYESSSLPSPTPGRSSFQSPNQLRGGIERLPSPTPTSPSDPGAGRSNFSHQSKGGAASSMVQPAAGQHSFSSSGTRPDLSSSSGAANGVLITSHTAVQMGTQPSNVSHPGSGQNPSIYTHGWQSGYAARPETVNANMTPNNPNAVPAQVAYGQWTASSVSNQAQSYGAGYAGSGNVASNMAGMPAQNAWRAASTNMPWGGQQQQVVNQNMVWAGPPAGAAFAQSPGMVAGAVGQQAGSAMPGGTATTGWSGAVPSPSAGSTNPGWAAQQGNTGGRGGDQNRNGGGGNYNRHSSSGSGGQRVCKFHETGHCRKGASCDYMHG